MTAAEAAAQIAALQAKGPSAYGAQAGVFSLDQLHALGQTGDMVTDFIASGITSNTEGPSGLLAGPTRGVITAPGLQAGYYKIPGVDGAEYYNPASGQASEEFIKWANGLTAADRDPFTGQPNGFIPAEGGPAAMLAARADQDPVNIATTNQIIGLGKGPDGTYQDAQDRVLGLGQYQQFMLDANGKQVRVADVLKAAQGASMDRSAAPYQDVSTHSRDKNLGMFGPGGTYGHWESDQTGQWWVNTATAEDFAANELDTKAAAADLNEHNAEAYYGLQQERIARGENPDTGISLAETKSIYETYNRIEDPAERAAYIENQDPGNLTAGLRLARGAARKGQEDWMAKNQMKHDVTWESSAAYGDKSGTGGGVKTTYGDVTMTDTITGRSMLFGNVPIAKEYVAPEGRGSFDAAMQRLGGAMYGAFMGFIGSFGNPMGAVLGAASGSGALGGINMKNPGKTGWGAAQKPGSIQDVALSMGEAIVFAHFGGAGMGRVGHAGFGAGFGTVNGFLSGGQKGAITGGIFGGVSGSFNKGGGTGQSWADQQYGPSFRSGPGSMAVR